MTAYAFDRYSNQKNPEQHCRIVSKEIKYYGIHNVVNVKFQTIFS